jgi:hypothetical protein
MKSDTQRATWPSGTQHLSDEQFVQSFESLKLANNQFRHYDHVRLTWIYLRHTARRGDLDVERTIKRMAQGIRAFALHHGAVEKYHETITRAFVYLVAAHLRKTPELCDFTDFAAAHTSLFDKDLPFAFYSKARLMSSEARAGWLEPDLQAFPR